MVFRSVGILFGTGLALTSTITPAHAGTQNWNNPSGGQFSDMANWQSAVPGPGDNAFFNLASSYHVTFDQNVNNAILNIRSGDITFDLGGLTYSLTSTTSDALNVGINAGDSPTLRINTGTITSKTSRLGSNSGSSGTLILNGPSSQFVATGTINVGYFGLGTVNVENGASLQSLAAMVGVTADGNATITGEGSRWTNTGDFFVGGPGGAFIDTLSVAAGGRVITPTLKVLVSGRIAGNSVLECDVDSQGKTAPGGPSQVGILTVQGNFVQHNHSQATMSIELGGTMPGLSYDVLRVTGSASLDKTLNVSLLNGYLPPPGAVFDVVVAGPGGGGVQGAFSLVQLPSLPNGTFVVQYLADRVRLIAPGRAVIGDATGDGSVNVADLLSIISAWGPCPANAACGPDFNHDGVVNVTDLLLVINHWG